MKGSWRAWGLGIVSLLALLLGPLLLFPTPLRRLAEAWAGLLIAAFWLYAMATFVGLMARASTPPLALLERGLRLWVARFAPEPEALWLHWTRHAHHPDQAWWCLDRAVRLGGAEALFQEGLTYLEGGLGPGGAMAGVQRLERAARRGHPEAAFRYAEALRTGHDLPADPVEATTWYRRSALGGFGPAAAWLARAFEAGDGLAADAEEARRWSEAAARLAPHPPLPAVPCATMRPRRIPRAPGGRLTGHVEAAADRVVARRTGRWILLLGTLLLAGGALATVAAFFWAGSSGLHHLPLLMLAPPVLLLGWQAWRLRREGPTRRRDRLREAAEAGDVEACYRLGLAFRKDDAHRPKDDLSAALWFRRAAEAGHREAMLALAEAYRGGHGVVRDPRAATRWEAAART